MFNLRRFLLATAIVSTALNTNLHANRGCIRVEGTAVQARLCNGGPSISILDGQATIYAHFDGYDNVDPMVNSGCKLSAKWPAFYGDIWFGADSCLYDSKGNNIEGQCCRATTGGQVVPNPYIG